MQLYVTLEPSGQTTPIELLPLMLVLGEAGQPPRKRWTQEPWVVGTKQGLPVLGPLGFSAATVFCFQGGSGCFCSQALNSLWPVGRQKTRRNVCVIFFYSWPGGGALWPTVGRKSCALLQLDWGRGSSESQKDREKASFGDLWSEPLLSEPWSPQLRMCTSEGSGCPPTSGESEKGCQIHWGCN